jgi:general secretion pathway protein D
MTLPARRPLAALLCGLALGLAAPTASGEAVPEVPLLERLRAIDNLASEPKQLAKTGLEFLAKGRNTDASHAFNSALQLSPSNSYLQLLNGLAYHLMAADGDSEKYQLAEQGYLLAVQFDRNNWLARYYLGNLRMDRRQFSEAQSAFAEALLYVDADRDMIYQLAAASYYAGDPATAAAALGKLETLEPNQPRVLRAMAVVMAALGRSEEANRYLDRYRTSQPDSRAVDRLAERVRGWERFHHQADATPTRVQFFPGAPDTAGQAPSAFPADPATQAPAAAPGSLGQPPPTNFGGASANAIPGSMPAPENAGERMVLVDVVILRTEDLVTTRKGINLLSGLSIQFGAGGATPTAAAATSTSTKTFDYLANTTTADTKTITRAITLPALTYSLNIVNANSSSNEILARPTIAALEGVKSEFFSGTSLSAAAISSSATGGGAGTVQIEKEIGVKLAITPRFLDDNRVKMEIIAERTFIKAPSTDNNFTYKLETSKTTVNAQTALKFGETLILSGLSEKETNRSRDGVPILQDIPLLQYLFSRNDTSAFQRSVLILVTPRRAEYVYKGDQQGKGAVVGNADSEALSELRARYTDWFKPYPNLASVFHHLGSSVLYREFRTGDVTLERWEKQATLQERLHQVVDYLYY